MLKVYLSAAVARPIEVNVPVHHIMEEIPVFKPYTHGTSPFINKISAHFLVHIILGAILIASIIIWFVRKTNWERLLPIGYILITCTFFYFVLPSMISDTNMRWTLLAIIGLSFMATAFIYDIFPQFIKMDNQVKGKAIFSYLLNYLPTLVYGLLLNNIIVGIIYLVYVLKQDDTEKLSKYVVWTLVPICLLVMFTLIIYRWNSGPTADIFDPWVVYTLGLTLISFLLYYVAVWREQFTLNNLSAIESDKYTQYIYDTYNNEKEQLATIQQSSIKILSEATQDMIEYNNKINALIDNSIKYTIAYDDVSSLISSIDQRLSSEEQRLAQYVANVNSAKNDIPENPSMNDYNSIVTGAMDIATRFNALTNARKLAVAKMITSDGYYERDTELNNLINRENFWRNSIRYGNYSAEDIVDMVDSEPRQHSFLKTEQQDRCIELMPCAGIRFGNSTYLRPKSFNLSWYSPLEGVDSYSSSTYNNAANTPLKVEIGNQTTDAGNINKIKVSFDNTNIVGDHVIHIDFLKTLTGNKVISGYIESESWGINQRPFLVHDSNVYLYSAKGSKLVIDNLLMNNLYNESIPVTCIDRSLNNMHIYTNIPNCQNWKDYNGVSAAYIDVPSYDENVLAKLCSVQLSQLPTVNTMNTSTKIVTLPPTASVSAQNGTPITTEVELNDPWSTPIVNRNIETNKIVNYSWTYNSRKEVTTTTTDTITTLPMYSDNSQQLANTHIEHSLKSNELNTSYFAPIFNDSGDKNQFINTKVENTNTGYRVTITIIDLVNMTKEISQVSIYERRRSGVVQDYLGGEAPHFDEFFQGSNGLEQIFRDWAVTHYADKYSEQKIRNVQWESNALNMSDTSTTPQITTINTLNAPGYKIEIDYNGSTSNPTTVVTTYSTDNALATEPTWQIATQ